MIGLVGAVLFGWRESRKRALWLGAITCIVAIQVFTVAWFLPTNAQFVTRSIPLDQVPGRLDIWLMFLNVRILLATAASALGILAVAR